MNSSIKTMLIALHILLVHQIDAMVPYMGQPMPAVVVPEIRVTLEIKNNSDRTLTVYDKPGGLPVYLGAVKNVNNTLTMSNIRLEQNRFVAHEQDTRFLFVDPQMNRMVYMLDIRKYKAFASEERRFVISFIPTAMDQIVPEPVYFDIDPSKGAVTVLITVTLGDNIPENPTLIDVTSLQGPEAPLLFNRAY